MGEYQTTNYPGIFKYVGKKKTVYGIDYYAGGKKHREIIGSLLGETQEKLAERRRHAKSGIYIPLAQRKKFTFGQLREEYEKVQKGEPYFEKSRKYYLKILEDFLGKGKKLYQITPLDIEQFKAKRKETLVKGKQIVEVRTTVHEGKPVKEKVVVGQLWKTRSDISVNRELETFRTILNKAVEWGWMEKTPSTDSKGPTAKALYSTKRTMTAFAISRRMRLGTSSMLLPLT